MSRVVPMLMGGAVALSALFSFFGLNASYVLDWPPGSTIALFAALIYFSTLLLKNKKFLTRSAT